MGGQPAVISGKVSGPNGKPVAEASIYFSDGPEPLPEIAALTNDDGTFSITAPQSGKYVIKCVKEGFAEKSVTVSVTAGKTTKVDIQLKKRK
jgi:uncharacterized GH25 family protein